MDAQARHRSTFVLITSAMVNVVLLAGILWLPFTDQFVGFLVILLMLGLMFSGVPVAVGMAVAGFVGILAITGERAAATAMSGLAYDAVASWSLSVLPLFILMGMLVAESGLAMRVYDGAAAWLGWVPGGMAVTTTVAGAGLAATSGSTLGIVYAIGRSGISEMLRKGYDHKLATGSVMVSGTLGQIIPPSILLVIYAGIAQTSVGAQLMAGLVPGLLLTFLYIVLIVVAVVAKPDLVRYKGDERRPITFRERARLTVALWPLPLLILVVLGGMLGGVFTATEAAAGGAACSVLILLVLRGHREFGPRFVQSLKLTLTSGGSLFLLIIGTYILGRAIAVSGLPRSLAAQLVSWGLSPWTFLVLVALLYLFLGTALEPLAMLLITVPILLPAVIQYDISPLWFGIYAVLLGELAVISPPVGVLVFIVHGIVSERSIRQLRVISLNDVYKGALFFLPAPLLLAALIIAFPDIVEWLPTLMSDQSRS